MQAWEEFLLLREKELGPSTVKKWLSPLKVTDFDACNLYLEAKDAFQIHWFEEHIRPLLSTQFLNQNKKKIKVHLFLAKPTQNIQSTAKKKFFQEEKSPFQLIWDSIDPSFSLHNFIPSKENQIPYKFLCELVQYQPHQGPYPQVTLGSFNPIFLNGPAGSGKTHLLMACATTLKNMNKKVIYTRAETFTEHVVSSIRSSEMQFFRQAYRNIDVLLIDDVEIFSRKGSTQEELFHTFNTLHLEGKQIILSSKNTPQELVDIEPRLISRFEWGLVLSLEMLGKEAMSTLFTQKAENLNLKFTESASQFFLDAFKRSTHSILKALEALALRYHLDVKTKKNPPAFTIENIKYYLHDLIKVEEQTILTPEKIIKSVAEFYGIRIEDILGKLQNRECALPRQIAMYLCRKELNLAFMKIGDLFSRDHSTVMTSVKQIEKGLSDPTIQQSLATITKAFKHG